MGDGDRRFSIAARDLDERERLLAEAFEAGAVGAEELDGMESAPDRDGRRSDAECFRAYIYAPAETIGAVHATVRWHASAACEIGGVEALPPVDWAQAWRAGHVPIRISSRLVVRPPFVDWTLEPGQHEVVIDPGQAFGTGSHATTRLCLEWIDLLLATPVAVGERAVRIDRVLDVGTGSGVLALAALALGARQVVGVDLDPLAIEAAVRAANEHGFGARARFAVGSVDALGSDAGRFPLIVANLLRREIVPIAGEVASRLEAGGRLVLAGLLEDDRAEVLAAFEAHGLGEVAGQREIRDATGIWVGLCLG